MTNALDSRFLNAMVLRGALEKKGTDKLDVTIDRIEFHEMLKYENGQKDPNVYLMYFKGSDKPLKLAKTNIRRIIGMHGAMGKNWHGKQISLVIEQDRRPDLGTKGDCVRVLPGKFKAVPAVMPTSPIATESPAVELWEDKEESQ